MIANFSNNEQDNTIGYLRTANLLRVCENVGSLKLNISRKR